MKKNKTKGACLAPECKEAGPAAVECELQSGQCALGALTTTSAKCRFETRSQCTERVIKGLIFRPVHSAIFLQAALLIGTAYC